jgi:hypothetical protein
VSPVRRIPFARSQRPFSPEVLRLFVELERVPPSRRYADPRTRRLSALLNLMSEFWTVNFVNDTAGPCHPVGYAANWDWATCRDVRNEIVEALKKSAPQERGEYHDD